MEKLIQLSFFPPDLLGSLFFDPKTGTFSPTGTPIDYSTERHTLVKISSSEYIMYGGYDGDNLKETRKFNFKTGLWLTLEDAPFSHYGSPGMLAKKSSGERIIIAAGGKILLLKEISNPFTQTNVQKAKI